MLLIIVVIFYARKSMMLLIICSFSITARPEVRELPRFIMGQSMGGAIALKVHLKEPSDWDGVILVAPMCKVCPFLCFEVDVTSFIIMILKF